MERNATIKHINMTTEQIENLIKLCKGQYVSDILKLCGWAWSEQDIKDMAEYFGCANNKVAVAMRLSMGK